VQLGAQLINENLKEAQVDQSRIIMEYTRLLKKAYTDRAFERATNLARENGASQEALARIMHDLQEQLAKNDDTLTSKAQEFLAASSIPAALELTEGVRRYLRSSGTDAETFDQFLSQMQLIMRVNQTPESRPWTLNF